MRALIVLLVFAALLAARPAAAQDFRVPLDCPLGQTCIVQNYADADPAQGQADDPTCGPLSYDGHDGLDFRVPAALYRRGVAVLAPADGVIAGIRDGEPDHAYLSNGAAAVADRECGNGVVITHADGWVSQLCHMRTGSLRVRRGDHVSAGQTLGLVGLSGHTEFPHVHLTLRRNGETLDPLTGLPLAQVRCSARGLAAGAHWAPEARSVLTYPGTRWFDAGFTATAPAQSARAEDLPASATRNGAALLFWALASGPRDGDELRVRLYGPDGAVLAEATRTQPRDQAQAWVYAGKRTPAGGWPAGQYRGEAQLVRAGRVVSTRTETLSLR